MGWVEVLWIRRVGVWSIHMDTDLSSSPHIQSLVSFTYGATPGRLADLHSPFLNIGAGAYGGRFRHIWVLYLCKRISHSPNSRSSEHHVYPL